MQISSFQSRTSFLVLTGVFVGVALGCGGGTGVGAMNPISAYLPVSTVVVMPGAPPVSVPIQIKSTSETALVSVGGLPAGVGFKYAASDTNPSGSLTFNANTSAIKGTYMPTVTVMSSGQTVSTGFTLIVKPN